MGTRNIERQIAKARLKIMGIEHVNSRLGDMNSQGVQNWWVALADKRAHEIQTAYGRKNRRKLRRVKSA